MKTLKPILIILALALSTTAFAALDIPSDGSDGDLIVNVSTNIDLSLATTGVWSNDNSAFTGRGIYDANKWAVVFKYSNIVIAAGATVTFSNHPSRAPVMWLVNGNVTIDGVVSLDPIFGAGASYDNLNPAEPGPGGFRGGARAQANLYRGPGFGPGSSHQDTGPQSGVYSTTFLTYGNPQVVPLIGGSGGAAWSGNGDVNGGGGGGAILIAASQTILVGSGATVRANSGYLPQGGYAGSGGAVRMVADQIAGSGRVEAVSPGYPGRIRLEANNTSVSLNLNPPTVVVPPVPLVIWPAADAPTVRIVSVDSQAPPSDPRAHMTAGGDDLSISTTGTNTIVLQTENFPTNGTVSVLIKPRNGVHSSLPAQVVSGNSTLATWQLKTVLPVSHTVIQVRAVGQ